MIRHHQWAKHSQCRQSCEQAAEGLIRALSSTCSPARCMLQQVCRITDATCPVRQDCTALSGYQIRQTHRLVDVWQRNSADLIHEARQISAKLLQAKLPHRCTMTSSETFDHIELLLTATALRLETNICLVLGFKHSILTPHQAAAFMAASYPLSPNWMGIAQCIAAACQPEGCRESPQQWCLPCTAWRSASSASS